MASNFEERFKGKISKMDRTGLNSLMGMSKLPVKKDTYAAAKTEPETYGIFR